MGYDASPCVSVLALSSDVQLLIEYVHLKLITYFTPSD